MRTSDFGYATVFVLFSNHFFFLSEFCVKKVKELDFDVVDLLLVVFMTIILFIFFVFGCHII